MAIIVTVLMNTKHPIRLTEIAYYLSTLSIIIIIVIIIINIYSHQLCLSRPTMNRPTLMQAYIGIQH